MRREPSLTGGAFAERRLAMSIVRHCGRYVHRALWSLCPSCVTVGYPAMTTPATPLRTAVCAQLAHGVATVNDRETGERYGGVDIPRLLAIMVFVLCSVTSQRACLRTLADH